MCVYITLKNKQTYIYIYTRKQKIRDNKLKRMHIHLSVSSSNLLQREIHLKRYPTLSLTWANHKFHYSRTSPNSGCTSRARSTSLCLYTYIYIYSLSFSILCVYVCVCVSCPRRAALNQAGPAGSFPNCSASAAELLNPKLVLAKAKRIPPLPPSRLHLSNFPPAK